METKQLHSKAYVDLGVSLEISREASSRSYIVYAAILGTPILADSV
jgi:hypothetical protein